MGRTVNRSAKTGRFVNRATVARWPSKTTTERVGGGNARIVNRSAATGRFIRPGDEDPGSSITQRV